MDKPIGRRIRYFFEYIFTFVLLKTVSVLPIAFASRLGGALLRLIGPMTPAHRVAKRNLKRAFPAANIHALSGDVWDGLGQVLFEYPHLSALSERNLIDFEGVDRLQRLAQEGNGGILFSGHLGNWELTNWIAQQAGIPMTVMYRAPNNKRVGDLLARCRNAKDVCFIPKSASGTKQIFATLSSKGFVGVLVDLRSNRGLSVNFLGGPALIAPTVALMARRYGCPIIPIQTERLGPARYRMTVHEPIPVDSTLAADAFVDDVINKVISMLESWIRKRPEQWFWMQRLWPEDD